MDFIAGFDKIAEFLKHPLVLAGFVLMLIFTVQGKLIEKGIIPTLDQKDGSMIAQLLLRYGFWLGVLIMLLGFGLQFYQTYADKEIKKAANYNIEKIVANLTDKYQQDSHSKNEQIKSLTEAITALSKGQVIGSDAQIKAAFEALEKGDLTLAKQRFEETATQGEHHAKQTAEAYRNLGALAFLDDTQQALEAYKRATQLEPDNADSWNQLGQLLHRVGELDQAITAFQKVLELGKKYQDQEKIAWAHGNLGNIYTTRGELEKAIEFHNKALEINQNLGRKVGIANQYGNLGNIYFTQGELEKAVEFYHKSSEIDQSIGNKQGMAAKYGNLGVVYHTLGELEKAIEFYNKSLEITEVLEMKETSANQYGNLGSIYLTKGELEKAIEFYTKALEINKSLGKKEGMAINYSNLGSVYFTKGELDKAIDFYTKALELNKSLGRKEGMAINYSNLGSVYKTKGNKNEAKRYYEMSLELFKYIGSPNAQKVQSWLDDLESNPSKNPHPRLASYKD